ncbi:hypothetical protein [Gorillibacterium sp. sgz5001074]|uniref:hypothetical protein n=1 Tax=Gorillibacterium sp. sgz5001074 TaxID=3446695 RepID=UPI003F66BF5B
MKITKWTKWQIGAVGAVGVALLFQHVKDSPEFAQASASHSGAVASAEVTPAPAAATPDPVVQEWQNRPRNGGSGSANNGGSIGTQPGAGQQQAKPKADSSLSNPGTQTAPNTGSAQPQTRTKRS